MLIETMRPAEIAPYGFLVSLVQEFSSMIHDFGLWRTWRLLFKFACVTVITVADIL